MEGWEQTYTGSEVRGVQFWVVFVLHGVINAVALPHQMVMSAQNSGVHSGHILQENTNTLNNHLSTYCTPSHSFKMLEYHKTSTHGGFNHPTVLHLNKVHRVC